jgi:hypothetical protein
MKAQRHEKSMDHRGADLRNFSDGVTMEGAGESASAPT